MTVAYNPLLSIPIDRKISIGKVSDCDFGDIVDYFNEEKGNEKI